ncbi:MAG: hypothetical protein ACOYYS_15320 [Chloroflexota bacterium]
MSTKQIVTRTASIFAGLTLAGVAVAVAAQVAPNNFAQTLMIAFGSAIFGSGLTFFLIRMSSFNEQ